MRKINFLKKTRLFNRLNDPYRLVLINDKSLEEVGHFELTKRSVYILFSTLFVVTILTTVCILLFTPLKYYIPGYGSNAQRINVVHLKQRLDSLNDVVAAQQAQNDNIKKVINGDYTGKKDTTMLKAQQIKMDEINSILPKVKDIKASAIEEVKKEHQQNGRKHRRRIQQE